MTDENGATAESPDTSNVRQDPILWGVLLGFFLSYLLFFILPVFGNVSGGMTFFRYVPTAANFIGEDAKVVHFIVLAWSHGQNPYALAMTNGPFYPPLSFLLLFPLSRAAPEIAYSIVLGLILVSFVALTFWFPIRVCRGITPLILLFFATGLVSYGLQFELERGQFNVIAVALCFGALYFFHYHFPNRSLRYLAYLLFTISVQLKIYPAIFIIFLVKDWSDWRGNLRRLSAIAAVNVALLFSMGYTMFLEWKDSLLATMAGINGQRANHSIASFVDSLANLPASGRLSRSLPLVASLLREHPGWIQFLFFGLFVLGLAVSLVLVISRKTPGIAPHLLLICTIGALIIPSQSFDYKLSLLPASMAVFMQDLSGSSALDSGTRHRAARHWMRIILVAMMSLAYSSTLFSFTNKPDDLLLNNSFPALMVMLVLTPTLAWLQNVDKSPLALKSHARAHN